MESVNLCSDYIDNQNAKKESKMYLKPVYKDNLKCLKLKLFEIDPESQLLNDFDSKSIGNEELESCQIFLKDFENIEIIVIAMKTLEHRLFKWGILDCFSEILTENVPLIIYRLAIIANEEVSEEVLNTENEKFKNLVRAIKEVDVKCLLKKVKGEI